MDSDQMLHERKGKERKAARRGHVNVHWLESHAKSHPSHGFTTTPQNAGCITATSNYAQVMLFVFLRYILSHFKAAYETLHRVDNICTDVSKSLNRNTFSSSLLLPCIFPFLSLLRRDTVLFRRNVAVDVRGWCKSKSWSAPDETVVN